MSMQQFKDAIKAFVRIEQDAVRNLRQAAIDAGFPTWEAAAPSVLAWASETYGVGIVVSTSPRNRGELVLDSTAKGYAAARTAMRRVREALTGDADADVEEASNKTTEKVVFEVPAEVAALAAKLVAATLAYDMDEKGYKALAAQAIAEAFAAAKKAAKKG